ncbi:MAG: AMP-binding protein, partial [Spirosomataceae bacterium]
MVQKWEAGETSFCIQTSGSTGKPKEITILRSQIIASIETTKSAFGLDSGDCVFCCLHTSYIAGMMMVFRARYLQLEFFVVPPSAQPIDKEVYEALTQKKYKQKVFFAFVPMQLQYILEDELARNLLNNAKAILVGGAPISAHLQEKISQHTFPIWATYGMTETVSHVAIQAYSPTYSPYFTALTGVQIRQNEDGCLEIHSEMSGVQWLVTNDLVEMKTENSFRIVGRKDQTINSGGVKIPLGKIDVEISNWFASREISHRFFAWGEPDEVLGQRLVIYLEAQQPPGTIEDFWAFASQRLKTYEKPKAWICISHFEETPTAKIDK